ncbi:MAG: hypothetical protein LBE76_01185 [Nitrososphaerota archaeon]|jgi:hypothetical protein|nr:hypothetical protein [Nitrososphaerota archaeon]
MKKCLIKIFTSLFVVLFVVSFFGTIQVPIVNQTVTAQENFLAPKPPTGPNTPPLDPSQTIAAQEKALNIIQNVIQTDLSKYNLELKINSIMDGLPLSDIDRKITNLMYALTPIESNDNENSVIEIAFTFEKNVLTSYFITPIDTQNISTTQHANCRDAIASFLEKYQQNTNIDSNNLITMLNNVNLSKNSTTTQKNTKFDILVSTFWGAEQTQLKWTHTINGADYTKLEISVNADNIIISVYDTRALYTIGDASVNISKEQAIDIALGNLKYYSYALFDGEVVTDFKVSRSNVVAKLVTSPVGYELRPYWDVKMMLDEVYPGNVHGIAVGIWANTGEFTAYSNMAYGGYDVDDDVSDAGSYDYLIVFVVVVIVVVAVVALAFGLTTKKKTHKTPIFLLENGE